MNFSNIKTDIDYILKRYYYLLLNDFILSIFIIL